MEIFLLWLDDLANLVVIVDCLHPLPDNTDWERISSDLFLGEVGVFNEILKKSKFFGFDIVFVEHHG